MKRFFGLMYMILSATGLLAAQFTVTGNGSYTDKPDYVEISVKVHSKCFLNMAELKATHKGYVAELQNRFLGYFDHTNDFNGADAQAGYIAPYSHTIYGNNGHSEEVCKNTYQMTTTFTIKSSDLDNFSDIIEWIHSDVGEVFASSAGDEKSKSTQTTISAPSSKICDTTRAQWRKTALHNARKNAFSELETELSGLVNLNDVCLVDGTDPGAVTYNESYAPKAAFMDRSGETRVNYTADKITVSASRTYIFKTPTCYPFRCTTGHEHHDHDEAPAMR